jgi:RND family efflux transporter MFP subunit
MGMALTRTLLRIAVTAIVVVVASLAGWRLWTFYTLSPWTRDALVQANVVELAPEVSGSISQLNVVDNQIVHKGDVLFVIDQSQYKVAVQRAQALVVLKRQASQLAQETAQRNLDLLLSGTVSQEMDEDSSTAAQESLADLQVAEANLNAASINLARTIVRSSVNGYVTHLTVVAGDYATAGRGVLALVDSDSFYIDAYFVETKLPAIQLGARAEARLMAGDAIVTGTVEGISRAIADREATNGLLAVVKPNFDWIRLAQRIPVRIKLLHVPPDVRLIAGLSCTVVIDPKQAGQTAVNLQ